MFEQQTPKSPQTSPQPVPNKPTEDMFASTDPVAVKKTSSAQPQPLDVARSAASSPVIPNSAPKRNTIKMIALFIIVVIGIGVGVGAVAYYFTKRSADVIEQPVLDDTSETASEQVQEPATNVQTQLDPNTNSNDINNQDRLNQGEDPLIVDGGTSQNMETQQPIDQDHDGLPQQEESNLGTSDNLLDTDLDGLSDWDEVRVYKTNPVNTDTDGDGYIDGHEVQNGYSPTGPGKLLDVPQQ